MSLIDHLSEHNSSEEISESLKDLAYSKEVIMMASVSPEKLTREQLEQILKTLIFTNVTEFEDVYFNAYLRRFSPIIFDKMEIKDSDETYFTLNGELNPPISNCVLQLIKKKFGSYDFIVTDAVTHQDHIEHVLGNTELPKFDVQLLLSLIERCAEINPESIFDHPHFILLERSQQYTIWKKIQNNKTCQSYVTEQIETQFDLIGLSRFCDEHPDYRFLLRMSYRCDIPIELWESLNDIFMTTAVSEIMQKGTSEDMVKYIEHVPKAKDVFLSRFSVPVSQKVFQNFHTLYHSMTADECAGLHGFDDSFRVSNIEELKKLVPCTHVIKVVPTSLSSEMLSLKGYIFRTTFRDLIVSIYNKNLSVKEVLENKNKIKIIIADYLIPETLKTIFLKNEDLAYQAIVIAKELIDNRVASYNIEQEIMSWMQQTSLVKDFF